MLRDGILQTKGNLLWQALPFQDLSAVNRRSKSLGEDPATSVKVTTSLLWSKSPLQLASLADAFRDSSLIFISLKVGLICPWSGEGKLHLETA